MGKAHRKRFASQFGTGNGPAGGGPAFWIALHNGDATPAHDVANLFINENGYRTVQVVVSASGALYCSHLVVGWTAWYRC